jgi:hypothetical protein
MRGIGQLHLDQPLVERRIRPELRHRVQRRREPGAAFHLVHVLRQRRHSVAHQPVDLPHAPGDLVLGRFGGRVSNQWGFVLYTRIVACGSDRELRALQPVVRHQTKPAP